MCLIVLGELARAHIFMTFLKNGTKRVSNDPFHERSSRFQSAEEANIFVDSSGERKKKKEKKKEKEKEKKKNKSN